MKTKTKPRPEPTRLERLRAIEYALDRADEHGNAHARPPTARDYAIEAALRDTRQEISKHAASLVPVDATTTYRTR
jgi:hypothetical protein